MSETNSLNTEIAGCAVTGANGYVGSVVADALKNAGIRVVPFCRKITGGSEGRFFHLGDNIDQGLFDGIDTLVHCAWDFEASRWDSIRSINVEGSVNLFQAAKKAGVKTIVFISTMSAFPGCKSKYGRAKLDVETQAASLGVHVVRPGLVYGPGCRGMVGSLAKLAGLPVLPLVGTGRQKLYLAHEEDLGNLVKGMCKGSIPREDKPVIAANERAYLFREILELLAASRGKKPFFLFVPWQCEWAALKLMELIGLKVRLRSDSLISLINQEPSPDFEATGRTGAAFRDFAEAVRQGLRQG